jgi:hypothetical protein
VLRLLGAAMVTLAVVPWLGVSAAGAEPKSDPPGFNGTVKIHDDEPEPSPVRKNQPHVCDFHVHGFNFDAASSGTWRIDQHPPTGRATVMSGTWTADTDGDWRTEEMVLPDGHYKLYVDQTVPEAPGGMKHKVFWVRCGEETSTPTPSGGTTTPTGGTTTPTGGTTTPTGGTTTPTGGTTTPTGGTTTPTGGTTTPTGGTTTPTGTVTETSTVTVSPSTITTTAPGSTTTVTESGPTQTVTVTESGPTSTVTTTGPGNTTTVTQPGSTETVTVTVSPTGGGTTVTGSGTPTQFGTTPTGGGTSPTGGGTSPTGGGTESPTGGTASSTTSGGVGVLPTKIGNTGDTGDTGDTGVLGTKTGVLADTGLELPMGTALGISFALLLAGGALMVLPSRLAVERKRRH